MRPSASKICFVIIVIWTPFAVAVTWAGDQPPIIAQSITTKSQALCRCGGEFGEGSAKISKVLAAPLKPSGFEFAEEPLENVVRFLRDEYDIPIQIDEPGLEDAGLTRDEPVTVAARNIALDSALRLMLKAKGLTYIIQNESLVLTTLDASDSQQTTCVYDVRDIVQALPRRKTPAGASAWADYDPVIGVITKCVCPDTWKENGSKGDVRSIAPGVLVIYQAPHVHEQVANLLNAIRQTLRQPVQHLPNAELVRPVQAEIEVKTGGGGGYGIRGGRGGDGARGGYGGEMERGREPEPTPATDDLFGP
jgi:hypothetical protein